MHHKAAINSHPSELDYPRHDLETGKLQRHFGAHTWPIVSLPVPLWKTFADAVLASADRLVLALAAPAYFLVGMLKFDMVIVAALVVLLPLQMPLGFIV